MKLSKIAVAGIAATAVLSISACSSDEGASSSTSAAASSASTSQATSQALAPTPTVDDLNAILAIATDPNATIEQKINTVQGGQAAPELFDTMTASKIESGAQFQVVQPILPGYTPDSVLATVNFILPDKEPQSAENVEFVYEDGTWKLSQSWACTLVTNTVAPEQVPAMCSDGTPAADAAAEPPAAEVPAEVPAEAPAEAPADAAVEQAPAQ